MSTEQIVSNVPSQFEYRKYEIVLLSNKDIHLFINSITVKDELEMLSLANLTETKLFEEITKFIFKKIDSMDRVKYWDNNLDKFESSIIPADRELLLLGTLAASYEDDMEITQSCEVCNTQNDLKINIFNITETKGFDKGNLFERSAVVELGAPLPCRVQLGYPTVKDVKNTLKFVDTLYGSSPNDEMKKQTFMLRIFPILTTLKKFEYLSPDSNNFIEVPTNDLIKINSMIQAMTSPQLKKLTKAANDILDPDNIKVELKIKFNCKSCGHENEQIFGPTDFFFQTILT